MRKEQKKALKDVRKQMISDGITPFFEEKNGDFSVISFYERKIITDFKGRKHRI